MVCLARRSSLFCGILRPEQSQGCMKCQSSSYLVSILCLRFLVLLPDMYYLITYLVQEEDQGKKMGEKKNAVMGIGFGIIALIIFVTIVVLAVGNSGETKTENDAKETAKDVLDEGTDKRESTPEMQEIEKTSEKIASSIPEYQKTDEILKSYSTVGIIEDILDDKITALDDRIEYHSMTEPKDSLNNEDLLYIVGEIEYEVTTCKQNMPPTGIGGLLENLRYDVEDKIKSGYGKDPAVTSILQRAKEAINEYSDCSNVSVVKETKSVTPETSSQLFSLLPQEDDLSSEWKITKSADYNKSTKSFYYENAGQVNYEKNVHTIKEYRMNIFKFSDSKSAQEAYDKKYFAVKGVAGQWVPGIKNGVVVATAEFDLLYPEILLMDSQNCVAVKLSADYGDYDHLYGHCLVNNYLIYQDVTGYYPDMKDDFIKMMNIAKSKVS